MILLLPALKLNSVYRQRVMALQTSVEETYQQLEQIHTNIQAKYTEVAPAAPPACARPCPAAPSHAAPGACHALTPADSAAC